MSTTKRVAPRVVVCLALALSAAPSARAWEPDVHVAIARGAMGISAAAEARVPLEYRDVLMHEVAAPDYVDKDCRYHCADTGAKEPALVAEQLLATLTSPKVALKPYQRAQVVGRYLHYVMDAVAPGAIRRENAPKLVNFFANRDFIFFREHRPAAASLSATLRERAAEMLFANANEEMAWPANFRTAVNATADALLLLPPRPDGVAARDEGPVWFLVNRVDTGLAGKAQAGGWTKTTETGTKTYTAGGYTWESTGTWTTWEWNPGSKGGGESFRKLHMLERLGVLLVELQTRQEQGKVLLRGLLFNNNDICAENVGLKAGTWSWKMPGTMPAHSVRTFEVEGPADLLKRQLTNGYRATQCDSKSVPPPYVSTLRRVVVGLAGQTPRFDEAGTTDISGARRPSTQNMGQRSN